MTRVIATAAAALLALVSGTAQAATASEWASREAAAWASPAAEQLDSAALGDVFAGVLDIRVGPGQRCQPNISVSLPQATKFSLLAALIGFPDRKDCPAAVPVSIMNIGVKAGSASDMQAAKAALIAALPKSCFDGVLPSDGRRNATPPHMTAWADPQRLLTFVWENYDPTVFTITYVRRDLTLPDGGEQDVYAHVRDALLHPIPAACLGQAR